MKTDMNIRIEQFDEFPVARIRHVGPYNEVGPCFQRLFEWVNTAGVRTGRVLTLSHDNPEFVAQENLRSDACVELLADVEPPPGICRDTVAAGRHAVYSHRGPYDDIPGIYRRLFQQWLPQSGEVMSCHPCMEIYFNSPYDTPADELLTDICLPLKPVQQD